MERCLLLFILWLGTSFLFVRLYHPYDLWMIISDLDISHTHRHKDQEEVRPAIHILKAREKSDEQQRNAVNGLHHLLLFIYPFLLSLEYLVLALHPKDPDPSS